MPRYAAFLRGVIPVNAKMPDLKKAFEAAGFTDVKTILGSGNVVFSARAASEASLERRAEAAMTDRLGRTFLTIIRPIEALRDLLASDPYRAFRLEPSAKRVVTVLRRRPTSRLALPIEFEGARILAVKGAEAFSAYVRHPKSPLFKTRIDSAFGAEGPPRTCAAFAKVA